MFTIDANVWIASFEVGDAFRQDSVRFLACAARRRLPLFGPNLVIAETACGVARRTRNSAAGERAARLLLAHPALQIVAADDALLRLAVTTGCRSFLRGMDACYAATAQVTRSEIISWDDDLLERFGGVTPAAWVTANGE